MPITRDTLTVLQQMIDNAYIWMGWQKMGGLILYNKMDEQKFIV